MSHAILFHFLRAQHVSDINIHHQELATVLLNYHIGRFVIGSLCVGDLVRLGLSSVRVRSLQVLKLRTSANCRSTLLIYFRGVHTDIFTTFA